VAADAVEGMREIRSTIESLDAAASSIASAVETQSAETQNISARTRRITEAAGRVTGTVSDLSEKAGDTGQAAQEVVKASETLNDLAKGLDERVARYLVDLRTSSAGNRRGQPRAVRSHQATVFVGGQAVRCRVIDISTSGIGLADRLNLELGSPVELEVLGIGRLRASVARIGAQSTGLSLEVTPDQAKRIQNTMIQASQASPSPAKAPTAPTAARRPAATLASHA
jgi:methyl-accepting chemotaxis protein